MQQHNSTIFLFVYTSCHDLFPVLLREKVNFYIFCDTNLQLLKPNHCQSSFTFMIQNCIHQARYFFFLISHIVLKLMQAYSIFCPVVQPKGLIFKVTPLYRLFLNAFVLRLHISNYGVNVDEMLQGFWKKSKAETVQVVSSKKKRF